MSDTFGLLGPSKASVTARSRTPSGFRAAVRFTPRCIEFIPHRLMFNLRALTIIVGRTACGQPVDFAKSGEHVDRLWTTNSDRPQAAHINPPTAHTPPGHLGCRSFAITTTNLIDQQEQLLRNINLHGERCLSHVGTEGRATAGSASCGHRPRNYRRHRWGDFFPQGTVPSETEP